MERMTLLTVLRQRVARCASVFLLAAAFMLAAGGDVLGQHACPHHDVPAGSDHDSAAAALDSGHDHHDGVADAAAHTAPDDDHAPCNCIGDCHGSAASPLPSSDYARVAAAVQTSYVTHSNSADGFVVRLLPHVLPFANGPPAHG
jgi:hypothetical protein